ncbi:MAG: PHB depolymerase family esterase [Polyangiales bacterium]
MTHPTGLPQSLVFLLLSLLVACGDDAGGGAGEGGSGGTPSLSSSLGCVDGTLDATLDHVDLEHDDRTRSYELHVPPSYDGTTPFPLVLNFHGFTSNGPQQRLFTQMDDTADANDFIVAYPNGISNSWNGGVCCGQSLANDVDDVGFTRAILEDLGTRGCVDLSRVYATGMSNGGFMSHRLACEAADIIAAIGPVAGVLGLDAADCNPVRPVPVIHFHGTADNIILYDGGGLTESQSVVASTDGWAARNGCTDEPEMTFDEGMVTCETASDCDGVASVTLCTIEGGGHCWPGTPCPDLMGIDLGISTVDINANDAMWALFSTITLDD